MRMRDSARRTAATLLLAAVSLSAAAAQTQADRARARGHYQAGWREFRSEAFDKAAEEFLKATVLDPEHELAYYGLGRAYVALKRYVEAIEAYRTSRRLFQQSVGDRFTSQQQLRRRWEDQVRSLDELIRESQQGPQTIQSQNRTRQLEDQRRRIRQNLDRDQSTVLDTTVPAFISLSLGSAYFRAEQFPEAEAEYKACLEADPKSGEAWNNLAVIYLMTSRLAEAEQAVASAERVGYRVSPGLKDEIARRKKS